MNVSLSILVKIHFNPLIFEGSVKSMKSGHGCQKSDADVGSVLVLDDLY